jgi:SAM-dependent methyltransferase
MPASEQAQLEVARHDVTTDAIPTARYDLIHARLVLNHLSQRRDVLAGLVQALRPGGWLVIEDFCAAFERGSEPADPIDARYRKVRVALGAFVARVGDNQCDYATTLPHLLDSSGLTDVGGEARVVFGRGGSPAVQVIEAGLRQVGDQMIAAGLVDRPALDDAITFLTTPRSIVALPTMVSAWGRRETSPCNRLGCTI